MNAKTLILFDVDGTLCESTMKIKGDMLAKINSLKEAGYCLGLLGGGIYSKICQQVGAENLYLFDYIFAENGIVSYHMGSLIHENSLRDSVPELHLQAIINCILSWIARTDLPVKRGTFIHFRSAMMYVTPIGGDCNYSERQEFIKYDEIHRVRSQLIKFLEKVFPIDEYNFEFLIGGSIGIGVHPKGWDKTYSLQFIPNDYKIHFFGDRYEKDGNDYSMLHHQRVNGHSVNNPNETMEQITNLFLN